MTVRVTITPSALDVDIQGWFDVFACSSTGLSVPLDDIVDARVATWYEARAGMGWRTMGGYVPGVLATGWYLVPGRQGARQFWAVFRDRDELLLVDTRRERPARLVLAVPDPHRLADQIRERALPG